MNFRMRILLVGILVLVLGGSLLSLSCATASGLSREPTRLEREAGDVLAKQMIDALGGAAAWERLEVISFSFVAKAGVELVRRRHDWDKKRGLHRLTTGDRVVYTDHWSSPDGNKRARVFDAGVEVKDQAAKAEAVTEAWEIFINDTWWLAAPFKVFDQGVQRAAMDGHVVLSFVGGTGLTSGDRYVFLLDGSELVGWSFALESGLRSDFDFLEPVDLHGVRFYTRRASTLVDIVFDDVQGHLRAQPDLFGPLQTLRPDAFAPSPG